MFKLETEDLQTKIEDAITYIQDNEPKKGYFVGFSGGKDSVVVLDIIRKSGVKYQTYYSMTLIDPLEVVSFIRKYYPEVIFLKPKMTFWQGILKKGLPLIKKRWCCDILKKDSSMKIPLPVRIMGIRAEESSKRKKRGQTNSYRYKKKNLTICKPIFYFTEGDIWDYIDMYNLPYLSLYDKGFSRVGCVICPFISNAGGINQWKKHFPGMYKTLDKYVNIVWEKDKDKLLKMNFTYEEFMKYPNWKTKKERAYLKVQGKLF